MSRARYRSQWYSSLISTHRIILTNQPDWPKIVPILHWFWNAILWWKKGKLLWTDFFHFVFHNCLDIWIIYTQRFCHIFLTQIGMSYKSKSILSATYRHFLLDSMCLSGCQINPVDVNFHFQKSLENFGRNSADKVWSNKDKGVESALPHEN